MKKLSTAPLLLLALALPALSYSQMNMMQMGQTGHVGNIGQPRHHAPPFGHHGHH